MRVRLGMGADAVHGSRVDWVNGHVVPQVRSLHCVHRTQMKTMGALQESGSLVSTRVGQLRRVEQS